MEGGGQVKGIEEKKGNEVTKKKGRFGMERGSGEEKC